MTLCFKFLLEWLEHRRGHWGVTHSISPEGKLVFLVLTGDGTEKVERHR